MSAGDIDFSADLCKLGKLLHYILTGRYLYREKLAEAFTEGELAKDKKTSGWKLYIKRFW